MASAADDICNEEAALCFLLLLLLLVAPLATPAAVAVAAVVSFDGIQPIMNIEKESQPMMNEFLVIAVPVAIFYRVLSLLYIYSTTLNTTTTRVMGMYRYYRKYYRTIQVYIGWLMAVQSTNPTHQQLGNEKGHS